MSERNNVSLASLIADTERLLASSTLARDLEVQEREPAAAAAGADILPVSSASSVSAAASIVQVRIRSPTSPSPPPPPPQSSVSSSSPSSSSPLLFSPPAGREPYASSPQDLSRYSRLTDEDDDDDSAPDVDITVQYDTDAARGHRPRVGIQHRPQPSSASAARRASSPTLRLSVSPSPQPSLSSSSVSFQQLNQLLQQNGFPAVPLPSPSSPVASSASVPALLSSFSSVLHEYHKRGELIQELLSSSSSSASSSSLLDRQQRRIDELTRATAVSSLEWERREAEMRRREKELQREVEREKERRERAEAIVRQKEEVILNLQAEVAGGDRRSEQDGAAAGGGREAGRDVSMFRRLHGREPQPDDEKDRSELRVIRLYEERVEELRREVEFLRRELAEVSALLEQRKREDGKEERERVQRESTAQDELRLLRSEARQRDAAYAQQEERLRQRVKEAEDALQEKQQQVEQVERESRRLAAELELRPDDRRYRDVAGKLRQAEDRLKEQRAKAVSGGSAEAASTLRTEAASTLRAVADAVGLQDEREVPQTVQQLCKVVSAVPGMQRFIRSVCDIVMSGHHSGRPSVFPATTASASSSAADLTPLMDLVLPTLRAWEAQLSQVSSLTELHARLLSELIRRSHPFHTQLDGSTPIALLFTELADLVSSENRLFTLMYGPVNATASLHSAASASPSAVPDYSALQSVASAAKMLAHFQHLFDVPHVNGVYPRMNELYVFAAEQRRAMAELREQLGLGSGVPTAAVLKEIRERLGAAEADGQPRLMGTDKEEEELRRGIESVERHRQRAEEQVKEASAAGGAGVRLSSSQRNELLLIELDALLGVSDHSELPAVVERLLRRHDDFSQAEATAAKAQESLRLLKQVKSSLGVASVADVLPAIHRLQREKEAAAPIRIRGTLRTSPSPSPAPPSSSASALLAAVKLHLDVTEDAELLPRLKKLLGRLGMYEDVMPSVDRLITQLYHLLGVAEIAAILPAVRRLKARVRGAEQHDEEEQAAQEEEEAEDVDDERAAEEDREEAEDDAAVEVAVERGGRNGSTARISSSSSSTAGGRLHTEGDEQATTSTPPVTH